ncbi:putative licABCH operon regulator [bioreactor metagenome]|uniref:Putative licABCH operon regulator n=1 Tax=bioreactor metagenome TaxID=1076179 RepID=A0A644ZXD1_9ZZZZ|nr:BglG family transcription antiterminator [Erysipelotrichaceae bacterium]
MESREIQIFKILAKADGAFIKSETLCAKIGIRPRTLREDLRRYRDLIGKESGSELESKTNQGYRLIIKDDSKFYTFLQNLLQEEAKNQYIMPVLQEDRVNYIIRYYLSRTDYIKSENLADELYVSRSTFSADLKKVKDKLAFFNLSFESKVGSGMKIIGSEGNIRSCIAKYYFHILDFDNEQISKDSIDLIDRKWEKTIRRVLYESIKKYHFRLTDIGYQNLVIHIAIAIQRLEKNSLLLENDQKYHALQSKLEFKIANEICDSLQKIAKIKIPVSERYYITIHLMGKRAFNRDEEGLINPDTLNTINRIFLTIKETYDYDFTGDVELFTMLSLHLQPMISRVQFGLRISNPLINRIKEENLLAFEIAVLAGKVISRDYEREVDENELGYLALHFQLAITRKTKFEKKNILIVCASGGGTSQILQYKVQNKFHDMLETVNVVNAYQLDEIDQRKYDFILSTIPITAETLIPVINVQYFLDDTDVINVRRIILKNEKELNLIKKCFMKDLFFTNQRLANSSEIIHFLCKKMGETTKLPDDFESLVFERESVASTALGNFVALPHPSRLLLDETMVAVCLLNKPVLWGRDEKPVSLVLLLGIKKNADEVFRLFNRIITSLLNNTPMINRIIIEPTYDRFMESILDLCKVQKADQDDDIFQ